MSKPIFLSADFSFDAADGDEIPRKFSGLLYSGGLVEDYNIVIDLDSTMVDEPMPLLHEHRRDAVIGTISSAKTRGNKLPVSGELFSDIDETAASLAAKHVRGARYQMSVGIFNFREELVPAGQKVRVNGKTFAGPVVVLRGGRIREGSIVTLGADSNTAVSFFSQSGDIQMDNQTGDQRVAALESAVADLTAKLEAANKRADEAEQKLLSAAKAQRTSDVKAMFAAVGLEFSDEAAAPYVEMSEAAFSATAKVMRDLHGARTTAEPNPALFSQKVNDGAPGGGGSGALELSVTDIYSRRNQQHANK